MRLAPINPLSVTGALFFKLKNVFFCLLPAVPSIQANVREMSEK